MSVQRKIFISYRQKDNPDFVDRIRDWFIQRYGRANVFMDFDSIPTGVKFADHIRSAIQQSDAVIAVIGPRWLELLREKAAAFEDDFVRIELSLALQLGKPVVPICIVGATVPPSNSLPTELRPMLNYNAAFLERTNFLDKIERIAQDVEKSLTSSGSDKLRQAQEYYERAVTKYNAKDYKGTVDDCLIAILLNPNFAEAYESRGFFYWAQGDNDRAIADCNEVIRLKPQNSIGYYLRGHAHHDKDDFDGAIADYSEAIRLDPKYSSSYLGRAHTRERKGDLKGAIADYQKFLDLERGKKHKAQPSVEQSIRNLKKRLKS